MRGYFGIGIDGASKTGNMGNLIRTAHAFGASFAFAIKPKIDILTGEPVTKKFTDTSKTHLQIPFYNYDSIDDLDLPDGCVMVGIELSDEAVDLPSFRHPLRAVYVMGSERSSLSDDMQARCQYIIKIPTKFSLNVATAGAIVMYDRQRLLGGFPERPLREGDKPQPRPQHVHGKSKSRRAKRALKEAQEKATLEADTREG